MLDGHHRPDEPPALPVQARDSELLGQWAAQFVDLSGAQGSRGAWHVALAHGARRNRTGFRFSWK
jgi:ectoine hydroxylase-related dioxygenase (phytanoyl-CoA dioxygenase family)